MKKFLVTVIFTLFLCTIISPLICSQNLEKLNFNGSMRIDFFEEFPSEENFSKAELIKFSSTIYIAASSLGEFFQYKDMLYDINPILEAGYWPILNESYWISPFSHTYELENLLNDLQKNSQNEELKVLLDLELQGKKYIKRNIGSLSFYKNKQLIKQLFLKADEYNIELYTGEYPSRHILDEILWNLFGITYPIQKFPHKKMIMFYSSGLDCKPHLKNSIARYLILQHNKYGDSIQAALGCIDVGRSEEGLLISPGTLDTDLSFMYKNGIRNVTIFRLRGLDSDYINVIEKYI